MRRSRRDRSSSTTPRPTRSLSVAARPSFDATPTVEPARRATTGLAAVATPLVAFVDTDVTLPAGWLPTTARHFADRPRRAGRARVVSADRRPTLIARYESLRSPLDLGARAGRVRAGQSGQLRADGGRSCAASSALRDVGGFDQSMRVGEDVDLVWRLDEAGYRVRYEPVGRRCSHRPRVDDAGVAAAAFRLRNVGRATRTPASGRARTRSSQWVERRGVDRRALAGWPVVGGVDRSRHDRAARAQAARCPRRSRGSRCGSPGSVTCTPAARSRPAITRAWWPLAAMAALVSKRCRRAVLLAAVVPPTIDWMRGDVRRSTFRRTSALRVLDDAGLRRRCRPRRRRRALDRRARARSDVVAEDTPADAEHARSRSGDATSAAAR